MSRFIVQLVSTMALCTFLSLPLHAQEPIAPTIQNMQGLVVVWNQHGFTPAEIGMKLQQGDEIRTGNGGKAYIDFPDNSRVKLGSRSRFIIQQWEINDHIFSSTLRMLQGAFRYTAHQLIGSLHQRRTQFQTRTVVLGVRGTDFWGRAEDEQTFFLLLEGKVTLSPYSQSPIPYDKAGYAVDIQTNHISEPRRLSMQEITPLAEETEITPAIP